MSIIQTIARTLGPYMGDEEPDEAHMYAARNIITVLGRIGHAIAPIDPTQDMISAGIIERHDQPTPEAWSLATENIYRAMIEAGRASYNG